MAHPRQLIEALMKRLLDAKKANKGKPDPKGAAVREARQQARGAQPSDPLAKPIDMDDFYNTKLNRDPDNPMNIPWREGGEESGPEFYRRTRPRDPSRLPDLAPEDPLKRPVESGLSRYLPEENIHEPMMPRTRDGSVRSRDPSRLPKSPDPIQDDVISNMPRPNPQEDAQKLFETLFNDAARGRDVDPRRLSMLDDMYPPYADIVEMEMKAQGKGIGGATIADDLDDIPF